jgi:hypothetical protein
MTAREDEMTDDGEDAIIVSSDDDVASTAFVGDFALCDRLFSVEKGS